MSLDLIKSQLEIIKILADRKLVTALAEIVLNLLAGNIKISEKDHSDLKKYK